jgi:hypothetical protein
MEQSQLRQAVAGINGVMVISLDGLTLAADWPDAGVGRLVMAQVVTAAKLGQRLSETVGFGRIQELVLMGEEGYIMVYRAGEKVVLVVTARRGANLGSIGQGARDAARKIARLMGFP